MPPDQYALLSSRPAGQGKYEFWLSAGAVSTSDGLQIWKARINKGPTKAHPAIL